MSYNVPAIYDVLPARIRACVARPGLAKCGEEKPHKGRKADWGFSEAEPPTGGEAYTVLLCAVKTPYEAPATDGGRSLYIFIYLIVFNILFINDIINITVII
jgi:hypothetical protein